MQIDGALVATFKAVEENAIAQLDKVLDALSMDYVGSRQLPVDEALNTVLALHVPAIASKDKSLRYEIQACATAEGHAKADKKCVTSTSTTAEALDLEIAFSITPDTAGDFAMVVDIALQMKVHDALITRPAKRIAVLTAYYPPSAWEGLASNKLASLSGTAGVLLGFWGGLKKAKEWLTRRRKRRKRVGGRKSKVPTGADTPLPKSPTHKMD